METRYYQRWIDAVIEFQSKSLEARNDFCSYCGCTGGCNLCTDLSRLDLSNPISYEEEKMMEATPTQPEGQTQGAYTKDHIKRKK